MPLAVEMRAVTKRFQGAEVVKSLDLEIPEGGIYGVIGPNGSGKTTTLRMILRILEPDEGSIAVLGANRGRTANDAVAYLPEERGIYRKLKVGPQLVYWGRLKGMSGREARSEAQRWLERFGLGDRWNDKTESLSKGMTQKLQFIAAVIARPRLLVLDEPFTGLDPVNLEVLKQAVLELRDAGATILFSTHHMPTAESMCDRLCMIHRGRKVLDGTLAAIRERYGRDRVLLRVRGAERWTPEGIEGVEAFRDSGQFWEIRLSGGSEGLLRAAMAAGEVEHFERSHPSLHEIFIREAQLDPEVGEAMSHV